MIDRNVKDHAMERIGNLAGDELLKMVSQLKLLLLEDVDCNGGLNEANRKRAWGLARDIGLLLLQHTMIQ